MPRRLLTVSNGSFCVILRMGWGQQISASLQMIYVEQQAMVSVLGVHSRPIKIKCGMRQGCPLSPLLFNLVIEMLAIAVRSCPGIEGIQLSSTLHMVSLYANDASFFLANPAKSLGFLQQWLQRFSGVSGSMVKDQKSIMRGFSISHQTRAVIS